jgi:hypothetical protein
MIFLLAVPELDEGCIFTYVDARLDPTVPSSVVTLEFRVNDGLSGLSAVYPIAFSMYCALLLISIKYCSTLFVAGEPVSPP